MQLLKSSFQYDVEIEDIKIRIDGSNDKSLVLEMFEMDMSVMQSSDTNAIHWHQMLITSIQHEAL